MINIITSVGLSVSLFFLFKLIEHEGYVSATEFMLIAIMSWVLIDSAE